MLRTRLIPFAFALIFLAGLLSCRKKNNPAPGIHVQLTMVVKDCLGTIVAIHDPAAYGMGQAGYRYSDSTYASAAVVLDSNTALDNRQPGDTFYADIAATPYHDYTHCMLGIPPSKAISILKIY